MARAAGNSGRVTKTFGLLTQCLTKTVLTAQQDTPLRGSSSSDRDGSAGFALYMPLQGSLTLAAARDYSGGRRSNRAKRYEFATCPRSQERFWPSRRLAHARGSDAVRIWR